MEQVFCKNKQTSSTLQTQSRIFLLFHFKTLPEMKCRKMEAFEGMKSKLDLTSARPAQIQSNLDLLIFHNPMLFSNLPKTCCVSGSIRIVPVRMDSTF